MVRLVWRERFAVSRHEGATGITRLRPDSGLIWWGLLAWMPEPEANDYFRRLVDASQREQGTGQQV